MASTPLVILDKSRESAVLREGYGVFAGRLRMWRGCAASNHRLMRFLDALGICDSSREHLTGHGRA